MGAVTVGLVPGPGLEGMIRTGAWWPGVRGPMRDVGGAVDLTRYSRRFSVIGASELGQHSTF